MALTQNGGPISPLSTFSSTNGLNSEKPPLNVTIRASEIPSYASDSSDRTSPAADSPSCTPKKDQIGSSLHRILPLSFGQSRFWFLGQMVEDKSAFNITFSAQLKGPLRFAKLDAAVKKLGARHDALRTCFFIDDADQQPKQGVLEQAVLKLEYQKIRGRDEVDEEYQRMKQHVYDLERGETMRIRLLSPSPLVNFLLVGYHHINMDGISLEVVLADLDALYSSRSIPPDVLQYSDFSVRQREALADGSLKEDEEFWRQELRDLPAPLFLLPFATISARPLRIPYDSNRVDARLPASLASRVKEVVLTHKVSAYHFFLAVYQVMLSRLYDRDDFCIGIGDGNRNTPDTANSVGIYLNLLPLRVQFTHDATFLEILKGVRQKAFAAMAHSKLPFDAILEIAGAPRSTNYSPLFQAFINYRQGVKENRRFAGCEGQGEEYSAGRTGYDITLDIMDNPDESTLVMLSVQKGLYSDKDATTLLKIFLQLVEAFSNAPESPAGQPSLFSSENIHSAIQKGRGPTMISDWPETLIHRVDDTAQQHPDTIALKDGKRTMTYKEMASRINSIAATLRQSGVGNGLYVGTYIEPSVDFYCAMLAAMRLGAIYVPLDVRLPISRLAMIVNDCQPAVILVSHETDSNARGLDASCPIIQLSTVPESAPNRVPILAAANDVAYLMYTSGTTGRPKGVKITHAGLRNFLEAHTKEYKIGAHVVLQQTAFGFDFSMDQVFTALSNGGTLVVVPQGIRGDPVGIAKLIRAEGVTYTGATPSELLSWIQYGADDLVQSTSWQIAVVGGEPFPFKLYQQFKALGKPGLRLLHAYGPTEISVMSNKMELPHDLDLSQRIPTGYTLSNYSVYILDRNLQPLPIGFPGEVFIGGAGVANGYLNNPQLDDKKFIPDPFASDYAIQNGWSRMYRTGDKGVLREDGALVILGRVEGDTQTKIRGIRIEVEEVEHAILKAANNSLSSAVVSPLGDPPTHLVAHVVFASNFPRDGQKQTRFLRQLREDLPLPQSMCPAAMVPIENLPLNTSGKLDRRAIATLPVEADGVVSEGKDIPLTSTETRLQNTWKRVIPSELLSFHVLSRDSDFFEVGGNSMLLVKLQAEIERDLQVQVPLAELFESSTLAKMTAHISSANVLNVSNIANINGTTTSIDWDTETCLSDILPARATFPPRIVGLTGATGFIGREILKEILKSDSVQEVHCIAVRNRERLGQFLCHPKVIIHQGNLEDANLGLQPDEFAALSSTTDLLIHNGADVSFMKTYQSLRAPNVESTRTIIRLALPRLAPVHYISSAVVGRLIPGAESFPEISVAHFPPTPEYRDGYGMSKWASEAMLEKAHRAAGLPVCIHRPSNVTGEGVPELDLMHNVISHSRQMRAIPQTDRWVGVLDFVSVEHVARGIVDDALRNHSANSTALTFRHQSSEVIVPLDDLRQYFRLEGKDSNVETIEQLPLSEWVTKAKNQGMSSLVAVVLEELERSDSVIVFQRLVKADR